MHLCTAQKDIKLAIKKTNKRHRLKGGMCTDLLKTAKQAAVSAKRKAENRKRYTLKAR
jgi:hypothetical protein